MTDYIDIIGLTRLDDATAYTLAAAGGTDDTGDGAPVTPLGPRLKQVTGKHVFKAVEYTLDAMIVSHIGHLASPYVTADARDMIGRLGSQGVRFALNLDGITGDRSEAYRDMVAGMVRCADIMFGSQENYEQLIRTEAGAWTQEQASNILMSLQFMKPGAYLMLDKADSLLVSSPDGIQTFPLQTDDSSLSANVSRADAKTFGDFLAVIARRYDTTTAAGYAAQNRAFALG